MFRETKSIPTYKVSLLKGQVHRAMTAYMSKRLEDYSISPPDWALVGLLYENENMQPNELAQELGVKPPVVTATIRRLENRKIIKKKKHTSDSRFSIVYLTENGRQMVLKAVKQMQKDLQLFLNGIKKSEIRTYFKVLEQIAAKLQDNKGPNNA